MTSENPYYQPPSDPDPSDPDAHAEASGDSGQTYQQSVQHSQVSARVPDAVGGGAFATGVLVQQGQNEFILDFVVTLARPHRVAARVIMPPVVLGATINAIRANLEKYRERFGEIPTIPKPPQPPKPPSIEEIYSQLKLPDDMLSGVYANAVMISHSASEFVIDFITNFYPRSAVASRVYITVPQAPRLLESMNRSFTQFQQRVADHKKRIDEKPVDQDADSDSGTDEPTDEPEANN